MMPSVFTTGKGNLWCYGGRFSVLKPACISANATTGYFTRFSDAQWISFPSFCQRCYSSLTELLTEMGHYTEAIKRYLTILAFSQKKASRKSHFQLWGEMIELLVSKAKDINTSAMQELMWIQ